MVTVARERITNLVNMAGEKTLSGDTKLARRYVSLARKIGMRYNVRLSPALRRSFCSSCLSYFIEGVNTQVRLKGGRLVRTCLVCGRSASTAYHRRLPAPGAYPSARHDDGREKEPIIVEEENEEEDIEEVDG